MISPTKLLAAECGNDTFQNLLGRAKCSHCSARAARVWLCAGLHREIGISVTPDWSIELVMPK